MISVIICTHNPRERYFQRCLDALRGQTLPASTWELVVIDNCSNPPLAGRLDLSWHPGARLVREDTLGLTPARLRGIAETRGDLTVFVDDDNVLDADYLATAARIADARPYLGAWSGQSRPGFDAPPPEWTRRYWGNLAIRQFEKDVWSNLPRLADTMPYGTGLCVRRPVAAHYVQMHETGRRALKLDRSGGSLLSGGDNDLAGCGCEIGFGVGLVAALKLVHLIPPERLTEDYLVRLVEGIHHSGGVLDHLYGQTPPLPTAAGKILSRLRRLLMRRPHAAIAAAAERGRQHARVTIAAMER